jgi:hypothetical protein
MYVRVELVARRQVAEAVDIHFSAIIVIWSRAKADKFRA